MKIKLLLISLSFIAFISCNDGNKSAEMGGMDLDSAMEIIDAGSPKPKKGNKCLLSYVEKRDQLITAEEIIQLSGFSKDVLEVDETQTFSDPGRWEYAYNFNNKRIYKHTTPLGDVYNLETPDRFAIKDIRPMTEEEFKSKFRPASDEELDYAKESVQQEVQDEAAAELAGDLTTILAAIADGERRVNNLGDLAAYNIVTGELKVLKNGAMFEVAVDASEDPKVNQKYAFEMARMILDKCN